MKENVIKIPADQDEITLYCYMGEALFKIQVVEQALGHSITLKKNPNEKKERADEFLKQQLSYTLGIAIKVVIKENLYILSLQEELKEFLEQRNWLVHKAMFEGRNALNTNNKKEEFFKKVKAISNKAESIHRAIEYDLINFCSSMGKDMSKILALLKLQQQGVRIQTPLS